MSDSDARSRRRWVTLGELIALAALIISAVGLWLTWKASQKEGPTQIVEQKQAIPLVLRGSVSSDGEELVITPVEASHALESLNIALAGGAAITLGSDGRLRARSLQDAMKDRKDEKGSQSVGAQIITRYVEMGRERRATGNYSIRYRWEGGGLFEGRSIRIEGLSR